MTGIIELTPAANGTLYTAMVLHKNKENKQKHEDIGFSDGWDKALDQLVDYMKSITAST